jgi:hypothetical protein
MPPLLNMNRCTPCLQGEHARCTGSAGNVGCGCIHAAPVPISLDPARVREHLADLERRRDVQQAIVDRLDDVISDEQQELASIERTLRELRAHPAVQAALAPTDTERTHP